MSLTGTDSLFTLTNESVLMTDKNKPIWLNKKIHLNEKNLTKTGNCNGITNICSARWTRSGLLMRFTKQLSLCRCVYENKWFHWLRMILKPLFAPSNISFYFSP